MAGRLGGTLVVALVGVALFVLWARFSESDGRFDESASIPAVERR
jgi:hypothetical protein